MSLIWPDKDPDEVLDYGLNWSARLGTQDEIVNSVWIVPAGIIKESDTASTTATTIWLSGGSTGVLFTFTNRITTQVGRVMDQSVTLNVINK